MRFTLTKADNKGDAFEFSFQSEGEKKVTSLTVSFKEDWTQVNPLRLKEGFKILSAKKPFTRDHTAELFKEMLAAITVNIPNDLLREVTKETLTNWAKYTKCPIEVRLIEHPQYPLLSVIYNHFVIKDDVIVLLIQKISRAVERAEITEELIPDTFEKESEEDLLDEIDEDSVVEFELDSEVYKLTRFDMHKEEEAPVEDYEGIETGEIIEGEEETE